MRRLTLLVLLLACGSESTGTLSDNVLTGDTVSGGTVDVGDDDPDSGSPPAPDVAFETPGAAAPTFCTENADCASGHCVENECADPCVDSCPADYACKGIASAGADVAFVCVPRFPKLCRPCATDADCRGQVEVGLDRCVSFGPEGSFCGGDCSASECPEGYTCGEDKQCSPDSGVCACRPQWVAEKASTPCTASNELGTCAGQRLCTPAGLSACDAPAATPEQCDNEDDD